MAQLAGLSEDRIRIYECSSCAFQTLNENEAKENGLGDMDEPLDYACSLCVSMFDSIGELEAHEVREHDSIEQLDGGGREDENIYTSCDANIFS